MKHLLLPMILLVACGPVKISNQNENIKKPVLVIHGGAGTIVKENMTAEREKAYRLAIRNALTAGYAVLDSGGSSIDAVVTAITLLEDNPLFNAGKGAVFTHSGTIELDASIMDGSTLAAGAVAGLTTVRNPIRAAFAVMTASPHVMLVGAGAEEFAREQGLDLVDPAYFVDSSRYEQFLRRRKIDDETPEKKSGTVGAVALDRHGNLAAGTSTGGMSGKRYGRVGDSPIIGAGTYADNATCAISSTGWGEYFIRLAVAHDISSMMRYAGLSLEEAADSVVMKKLPALGGNGGIIGVDSAGRISMTFNTPGMYRGYIRQGEDPHIFMYGTD